MPPSLRPARRKPDPGTGTRRTRANTSTTPQRDEATDTVPAESSAADAPYRDLKLPHERDESAERDASPERGPAGRPVIRQAQADVESGQRDTDCYNAVAPREAQRSRKRGPA